MFFRTANQDDRRDRVRVFRFLCVFRRDMYFRLNELIFHATAASSAYGLGVKDDFRDLRCVLAGIAMSGRNHSCFFRLLLNLICCCLLVHYGGGRFTSFFYSLQPGGLGVFLPGLWFGE